MCLIINWERKYEWSDLNLHCLPRPVCPKTKAHNGNQLKSKSCSKLLIKIPFVTGHFKILTFENVNIQLHLHKLKHATMQNIWTPELLCKLINTKSKKRDNNRIEVVFVLYMAQSLRGPNILDVS